jgi:hypothetical protein
VNGDQLYRRLRFYAGNSLRAVTSPWKQHQISTEEATTLFGCSYGDGGWHHLRKTLEEYDCDPGIHYRDTTLYTYLTGFTPRNICDVMGSEETGGCNLPVFVYPWGTFKKRETISPKTPQTSRFCGPSTSEFVADEFARTIRQYTSLKRTGYTPWRFPHTFIGGTMLRRSDGTRRFVVLQGNHRLAILAHLGAKRIVVRQWPGYLPVVRERDVARWPLVVDGTCSVRSALAIFGFFFEATGRHVLERLALSRGA